VESEVASSVKFALILIITGILIFTTLVLVDVVKPDIFDGINWVINTTDNEKARQYDDYDQKWVSGTMVLRALKLYEGTGFGIVYATKDTLASGNGFAINFGGIFQGATETPDSYQIQDFKDWEKKVGDNTFYTKSFIIKDDGYVLRYENKAVTRHLKTSMGYIQPDGRFYAELIKDITEETIGICFTQD